MAACGGVNVPVSPFIVAEAEVEEILEGITFIDVFGGSAFYCGIRIYHIVGFRAVAMFCSAYLCVGIGTVVRHASQVVEVAAHVYQSHFGQFHF